MKAVESFEVMESFGMKDLSTEELIEVDGGWCLKCEGFSILNCTCRAAAYIEPCGCKGYVEPCASKSIII